MAEKRMYLTEKTLTLAQGRAKVWNPPFNFLMGCIRKYKLCIPLSYVTYHRPKSALFC